MGASKPGGGRNGTKGTKGTEGTGTDCCNSASWQIFIWSNCIWDSGSSAGEWALLFGCDFLGFLGSLGALAGRFGASIASKGMGWISSLLWAKVHASPLLHMPLALNWKHNWVATKLGAWRISSEECAKLHASPIVQRLDFQYLHILVNFKVFRVSWVVIWKWTITNPQIQKALAGVLSQTRYPKLKCQLMITDVGWWNLTSPMLLDFHMVFMSKTQRFPLMPWSLTSLDHHATLFRPRKVLTLAAIRASSSNFVGGTLLPLPRRQKKLGSHPCVDKLPRPGSVERPTNWIELVKQKMSKSAVHRWIAQALASPQVGMPTSYSYG